MPVAARLVVRHYPLRMDHDAELDAILEQVETAGLLEQFTDDEGRPAVRMKLAMLGQDGQDALMAALLDEPRGSSTPA